MTTIANPFPNGDVKRITDQWIRRDAKELANFRTSGIVEENDLFNARASAEGNITSVPFVNPLSGDSSVGSDDLTAKIAAGNLTGDELLAVRQIRTKAWAGAELARLVTGLDPVAAITAGIARWRALDEQKVLVAMLNGVIADAVQNDAATMIVGDGTDKFDAAMLIDACQLKGERKDALTTIIMHSAVEAQLLKDNQIEFVPASDQAGAFRAFQGKRVVVSDAMPVSSGVYTSIVCAPGLISYGEAEFRRGGFDVVADELAGNGAGGDTVVHRRQYIAAVQGYSYTGAANPDNSALAAHANYVRKYPVEMIPLSIVKTALTAS